MAIFIIILPIFGVLGDGYPGYPDITCAKDFGCFMYPSGSTDPCFEYDPDCVCMHFFNGSYCKLVYWNM